MEINELSDLFNSAARTAAVKQLLSHKGKKRIMIDGLSGSAPAMLFSRLPKRKVPYLIVANDFDEGISITTFAR